MATHLYLYRHKALRMMKLGISMFCFHQAECTSQAIPKDDWQVQTFKFDNNIGEELENISKLGRTG